MPHQYPFTNHANPAESVSASGTRFQFPSGDKLVFDKQGRAYRVLGEIRLGNGKLQLKLETFNPFVTQQARFVTIDKAEIGGRYDTHPTSAPARIIGTRRVRDRTPDLSLPYFLDGTPCVNTQDDCLVVDWKTSELTRAVIYYDLAAVAGPYPVYDCGPGYGPPSPYPPIPSNYGGDFGPYVPGSDPYTYPYSYGYGGYSFAHKVDFYDTSFVESICGLMTNATYNVVVCIWDKHENGPICSENITVFLPTP